MICTMQNTWNSDKYRHGVMSMLISHVPIFSDSVFNIGTEWNGIGNGSKFFFRLISRSNQILTYIFERLSKGWIRRSHRVTDKNYIGQCQQKQSLNDWVFNAQTGWILKTNSLSPYCIFLKCVLFKQKKKEFCFSQESRVQNTVRSGIQEIACTSNIVSGDI